MSVPVVGFGTDEFPAFFSRESGPDEVRLETPGRSWNLQKLTVSGIAECGLSGDPIP
jgi:pseudouridine-5'-phosphate glycosidase